MLGTLGRWLAGRLHPGRGSLISFTDGELGPLATAWVEHHVSSCASCKREMERLCEDFSRFQMLVQPGPDTEVLERGLADLEQAMTQLTHDSQSTGAAEIDLAARRRFVAELEVYLGKRATAALLGRLRQDNRLNELVAASVPALAALLGRKTADAITARVSRLESLDSGTA
jgi:anti-sigma factor RsiW